MFNDADRTAMSERINRLTPESKALWGKMNVAEMLCHCADGVEMATGERDVADRSNFLFRTIVKPLVLYVLPMPKSAPTAPELNPHLDGTKPEEFENDRARLNECIEKLVAAPDDFSWAPHAAFGRMTRDQWGILIHKHIDHHLKQFGV